MDGPSPARGLFPAGLALAVCAVVAIGGLVVFYTREPATPPTVAVLRFASMGPAENEALARGIRAEAVNRLSRLGSITVISDPLVGPGRPEGETVEQLARRLGVNTLITGGVHQVGRQIQISVQVINARRGRQIWWGWYDRPFSIQDILEIQRDMAEHAAKAAGVRLSNEERQLLRMQPTGSLRAWQHYMLGNVYFEDRHERESIETAITHFARATELDEDFAEAFAGLARARTWLYAQFGPDDGLVAGAERALKRAIELAPDQPETRHAQGELEYRVSGQLEEAVGHYEATLELAPSNLEVALALAEIHQTLGNVDDAARSFERAVALAPGNSAILYAAGQAFHLAGRFPDAAGVYERLANLSLGPDREAALGGRFQVLASMGDTTEMRRMVDSLIAVGDPELPRELAATLAYYRRSYDEALALDAGLHILPFSEEGDRPLSRALLYHMSGRSELARVAADSLRLLYERQLGEIDCSSCQDVVSAVLGQLGILHAIAGNTPEAVLHGELGVRTGTFAGDGDTSRNAVQRLAFIYLLAGDEDAAALQLEKLLVDMPSEITGDLLRLDPRFEGLLDHPRLRELLASTS